MFHLTLLAGEVPPMTGAVTENGHLVDLASNHFAAGGCGSGILFHAREGKDAAVMMCCCLQF